MLDQSANTWRCNMTFCSCIYIHLFMQVNLGIYIIDILFMQVNIMFWQHFDRLPFSKTYSLSGLGVYFQNEGSVVYL